MKINLDTLKSILPDYLSHYDKEELSKNLLKYRDLTYHQFYTQYTDELVLLQGDFVKNVEFYDIDKKKARNETCILLSNTCDMDIRNKSHKEHRIVFSPIIKIDDYEKLIISKAKIKYNETDMLDKILNSINSHIQSVKHQHITKLFYLPDIIGDDNGNGYVVSFDNIYSMQNKAYDKYLENREISLSQVGHYLLLYKLSMHFCRFGEEITRGYLT